MAINIAPGDLSKGGAVVETSGGTKYAIFLGDVQTLLIYKDIDGIPDLADSESSLDVHGSASSMFYVHAAIDSNDKIHIVVVPGGEETRDVAYRVLDTADDTWDAAWVEAANYTESAPTNPGCSISIDGSDIPHILYVDAVKDMGTTYDEIWHAWDDGGWATELVGGDDETNRSQPHITCCPNDDLEALYYHDTATDPTYNRKNGAWGGEGAYAETDAIVGAVVCTAGDTVYRYHSNGIGVNQDIEENNVDTGLDGTISLENKFDIALVGTDRHLFWIDAVGGPHGTDVCHAENTGAGWGNHTQEQIGSFNFVIAEWAYNNEHQSGEINYIFDDGTDVFYDSFSLVAAGPAGVKTVQDIAVGSIKTINDVLIANVKSINDAS